MCQHCCRLEWTPCPTIPLSCPLCPMRLLSINCQRAQQANRKRKYHVIKPKRKKNQLGKGNQMCRGISDLYSNVVSAQLRVKASQLAGSKLFGRDSNGFPVKVVKKENVMLPTSRKEIPVLYEQNPVRNSWAWSSQIPNLNRNCPTVNPYILRKK